MSSDPIKLSHVDEHGQANMVDISNKQASHRIARAEGFVSANSEVIEQIQQNNILMLA